MPTLSPRPAAFSEGRPGQLSATLTRACAAAHPSSRVALGCIPGSRTPAAPRAGELGCIPTQPIHPLGSPKPLFPRRFSRATPYNTRRGSAAFLGGGGAGHFELGGGNVHSGSQLKTLDLGDQGFAHVRHRLINGRALSRLVLEELDLESGTVTTDVPAGLSTDAIRNLDWGGFGATDPSRSRQIQVICEHLRTAPGAVAICEDQLARSIDPLSKYPTKILTAGEDVYHLLDFTDANAHAVETTLSWQASAGSEITFLSVVDSALASSFPSEISSAELVGIAKGVIAVLVDAFDGESFAVWRHG